MTTTNEAKKEATHLELIEGVKGNGATKYMVVTVRDRDGSWLHSEDFDSKPEAECWLNHA